MRKQAKLEADCNMVILSIGFCLYVEAYLSGCGIQLATISRLMRKALHKSSSNVNMWLLLLWLQNGGEGGPTFIFTFLSWRLYNAINS